MKKKNKNVCYTVITGHHDTLKDPLYISENFDYICYTDQTDFKSNVWEIRQLPLELGHLDNRRKNRFMKWMPHLFFSDYDYSIYIDGNIYIIDDLNNIIHNSNTSICVCEHSARKCVYKEIDKCKLIHKDNDIILEKTRDMLLENNYPIENGLFHNNVLCRYHNNSNCKIIMENITKLLLKYTTRDQILFPYVLWKTNLLNELTVLKKHSLDYIFKQTKHL